MGMIDDRQLSLWEGQPRRAGAEPQGYAEASTCRWNTEGNEFNVKPVNDRKDLLEDICNFENMYEACLKVVRNQGAGGVDGMKAKDLEKWLHDNYGALKGRLETGKYRPQPVLRVEIPKEEKGKVRELGIPVVVDRMIQQAIVQVLTPIYEPLFSDDSYGFRPMRSAQEALLRVKEHADAGRVWCVSLDLEKFFDTVNQSKLIQLLGQTIKDGRVVSLIHRFLMAGVMVDGVVMPTEEGTPQGGPLSPLLANIVLNELDRELEERGHAFVRYADDVLVLKETRKAAQRVKESITTFIEKKLFLKVNREKTTVARISQNVRYLGYGFYKTKGEWRLRVHPKSIVKLKDKVRTVTARSNGWSNDYRRYRLKRLVYGWVNYFKLADMQALLERIDEWCRRRIRAMYWKQWKKVRTKVKALVKLGIAKDQAWQWANSRKAYWRIAGSWVLTRALGNEKLKELGWVTFLDRYEQVGC
jgi:group II intron reverse transcriptase/maturase